jgi:hypothetical protein
MTNVFLIAVITGVIAVSVNAQTGQAPSFRRYPVAVEKARVRTIDFKKNPDARSFRTRLSEGLKGGVNFAGHYTLVGWGCGTGCISGAIIDARKGNVIWPEQLNAIGVWYGGDEYADEPVAFKKNSRLLIISGSPGVANGAAEKPQGLYYYEWKNDRLRLVKFVKKDAGE